MPVPPCVSHFLGMMGLLTFLTTPSPGISYDFVAGAYLVSCLLGILLWALESVLSAGEPGSTGVDVAESIRGAWVIFVPFFPCLLWAVYLRGAARSLEVASAVEKKDK